MCRYATLNEENIVVGISDLSEEIVSDNMVMIYDLIVEFGSKYDRETGEFYPPEPKPIPVNPESLEDKLDRIEMNVIETNITQFDVMATLYEEIVNLREQIEKLKGANN